MKNNIKINFEKNFIFDEIRVYYDKNPIFKFGAYYGEVDKTGKILLAIKCDDLRSIDTEKFAICINDKWGIINRDKEWIIEPEYDDLDEAEDGFYIANKNGKFGIININNDVITDFTYDSFERICWGDSYSYAAGKNGKIGIINLNGRVITPFIFKEIDIYGDDFGKARLNGKYGLINEEGKPLEIDIASLEEELLTYQYN